MHISIVNIANYVENSIPIKGILHVGDYNKDIHLYYKAYTGIENIIWMNLNDINDERLQNLKDVNFLNISIEHIDKLMDILSFIQKSLNYIYIEFSGNCITFEELNILMINCGFNLIVYKINETNDEYQGGVLYNRFLS